ncbi:protein-methionine-sulfoxide reductase heme-binding subunit MsrQ [Acetobacter oeni]|uniref:Protein-methionine-sulfoxide reductase heme-binding subunit MsrQ n=1 Tax=Acetobacter oeni TaxID=304077 RepID=A0A511XL71_9PROT|nr:protein-methionine-sulfoxide reductase heme-binding subunit MsrQ [Acetobacter oeni]MBB3883927.1 sulfoxide reductase heme-binding subunit YedZ [Acetobacter oeni]NHO19934.1 protein-methionine-sulfoxide reductase heme-binding subunit MsrQ [Acetobacter oeni]GEN63689.1 protein-methionine-sulfoxide reductase heme-binding subunit MsrQ [Acetobacter oeni]
MVISVWWTRRSFLNLLLYTSGFVPACWSFWLGVHDKLGPDPVRSFEHILGLWAFRFLLASLAITPLRIVSGVNLTGYRRAVGLLAFAYVVMHVAAYIALDLRFDFVTLYRDITRRPFLIFGMAAFLCLVPLAVTSNRLSIRKLGRNWRYLHRLVYVALIAASIHFLMAFKTWHVNAIFYVLFGIGLLSVRGINFLWGKRVHRRIYAE